MKLTSMDILLHRYFDGDLSPEESEAFLRDVAADPLLAAKVEAEAHLDMALIDDIYSIDPPSELRAAVLDAVLVPSSSSAVWDTSLRAVTAIVCIIVAFVLPTTVTVEPIAPADRQAAPATPQRQHRTDVPTRVPIARVETSTMPTVAPRPPVEEQQQTDPASLNHAGMNATLVLPDPHSLQHSHGMFQLERPMQVDVSPHLVAGVRGLASRDVLAARVHLAMAENIVVFAEAGRTLLSPSRILFRDGIAQSESATQQSAYVAVGASYGMCVAALSDRVVTLSAGLGVGQLGPMAIADATIDVVNIRGVVLQVGAQWIGHFPAQAQGQHVPMSITPVIAATMQF